VTRPSLLSTRPRRLIAAVVAGLLLVLALGAPASAARTPGPGNGGYSVSEGACANTGPTGTQESQFLPMTRWIDATTDFHQRLSWDQIPEKTQRSGLMDPGMSVGNFLYSVSERMVSGALSFCMLDDAGYTLDHATAQLAKIFTNSAIMALLLVIAIIGIIARTVRNAAAGKAFKSVFSKVIILALFAAMSWGASNSTHDAAGKYKPGVFSPGWFAVTIDKSVTNLANVPVTEMYTNGAFLTASNTDPSKADDTNIFDCSVERAALRKAYKNSLASEESSALVPLVMSSIWENSGLETWKISQYGTGDPYGEKAYCHQLDMFASPDKYESLYMMSLIDPGYAQWAQEKVIGDSTVYDGQIFNPQGTKQRDIGIIAWAACQPAGSNFSAQVKNLENWKNPSAKTWNADMKLMVQGGLEDRTLSGDLSSAINSNGAVQAAKSGWNTAKEIFTLGAAGDGTFFGIGSGSDDDDDSDTKTPWDENTAAKDCSDLFNWTPMRNVGTGAGFSFSSFGDGGANDFNWGNDEDAIIQNTTGDAQDARNFILNLHGNTNTGGLIGVLIYVIASVGMLLVFGTLSMAVLLAKVMGGVLIVATLFVLLGALASNKDLDPVVRYGKTYFGLSLFAWGAIMLMAVIGLLTSILANLGAAFGGWLSILWSGLSPLLAAVILHKVFKDVLHIPSPFKLTAGLAYGSALGKSGASNAMSGLDRLGNRGAGFMKRTASSFAGNEMADRFTMGEKGKNGPNGPKRDGEYRAPGRSGVAGSASAGSGGSGGTSGSGGLSAEERAKTGIGLTTREAADKRATLADAASGGDRQAKKALREFDREQRRAALARTKELQASRKDRMLNYVAANKGKIAVTGAAAALGGAPLAAGVAGYMGVKAAVGMTHRGVNSARDRIAMSTGIGHDAMMQRTDRAIADMEAANQRALNDVTRERNEMVMRERMANQQAEEQFKAERREAWRRQQEERQV